LFPIHRLLNCGFTCRVCSPAVLTAIQEESAKVDEGSSTQVGAVVIDNKTRKLVSSGYNGFPRRVDDSKIPQTRPEKYLYVVHAELNAILHAQRDLHDCKLIVQCGFNQTLYSKIKKIANLNNNVITLGFVKSMRELYAASDIIITKPGAITVSELIVSKVPFILNAWPAVMPQERGNVEFVTENTLGCVAHSVQELPKLVNDNMDCKYLESPNNEIREKLYGTKKIGDKIVSLIKENKLD